MNSNPGNPSPLPVSVWPARLAGSTLLATWVLIFVGGLVTSTASGDTEPEWPFSREFRLEHGWMIEMGHRYIAMGVATLTWLLAVALAVHEPRRWVRGLGWLAVVGVMAQAGLGGVRIYFPDDQFPKERAIIGIVHTSVAQAFFAVVTAVWLACRAAWANAASHVTTELAGPGFIRFASALVPLGIYLQIVLGAVVRHTGRWVAVHVIMAMFVLALASVVSLLIARRTTGPASNMAVWLGGLLSAQLLLGVWALIWFDPATRDVSVRALIPTAHLALGVTCLAVSLALAMLVARQVRSAGEFPRTAAAPDASLPQLSSATRLATQLQPA